MGGQLAKEQEQLKNLNCKQSREDNLTLCVVVSEKELQKLYKNFSKIDKDKSGMLEPEEFFDIPGKNQTLS
jgi:Ca2+-binding EF-hand superfamily protein